MTDYCGWYLGLIVKPYASHAAKRIDDDEASFRDQAAYLKLSCLVWSAVQGLMLECHIVNF